MYYCSIMDSFVGLNLAEKHRSGWIVVREKHGSDWKNKLNSAKPILRSSEQGLYCQIID